LLSRYASVPAIRPDLDGAILSIHNRTELFSFLREVGKMVRPQELNPRARAKLEQIREGAQRVFLERGFAGASTDAIASEAGVSKQTLYSYYSSKETLLADVLRHLINEDPQNRLSEVEETSLDTSEELRGALDSLARRAITGLMQPDYLALIRVVIAETPRLPQVGALFKSAVPEQLLGRVARILEGARAKGVVGDVNTDAASRMFMGALLTYAILDGLLVGDGPPRPPEPERIEEVVDLYMKAISWRGD
jgi:TetR/AcrR family transcriptional repressor of mexJK operon